MRWFLFFSAFFLLLCVVCRPTLARSRAKHELYSSRDVQFAADVARRCDWSRLHKAGNRQMLSAFADGSSKMSLVQVRVGAILSRLPKNMNPFLAVDDLPVDDPKTAPLIGLSTTQLKQVGWFQGYHGVHVRRTQDSVRKCSASSSANEANALLFRTDMLSDLPANTCLVVISEYLANKLNLELNDEFFIYEMQHFEERARLAEHVVAEQHHESAATDSLPEHAIPVDEADAQFGVASEEPPSNDVVLSSMHAINSDYTSTNLIVNHYGKVLRPGAQDLLGYIPRAGQKHQAFSPGASGEAIRPLPKSAILGKIYDEDSLTVYLSSKTIALIGLRPPYNEIRLRSLDGKHQIQCELRSVDKDELNSGTRPVSKLDLPLSDSLVGLSREAAQKLNVEEGDYVELSSKHDSIHSAYRRKLKEEISREHDRRDRWMEMQRRNS
eukprot:CAMPEP_0177672332 /NCGR_PEP_ID=MMETSP0447-20121125/25268_1 /TAXON_ID=0 /ORGANISM="Stygamoeba regulata, Strain BSH-02190019" /LENGTH=439 /DNA_ID=CAMNT_0019179959 /DNA_START=106 /DNA_END=1425 /DNA_ORIENTATION=-